MSRRSLFSIVSAVALIVAGQAVAQTALPASVQADRAAIQQDQTNVQNAVQQLRADEAAGSATAAAADRTALRLARMKLAQDFAQLHQDAQPMLAPDRAALTAALTKLYSDQTANNVSAVQLDQAAVTAAEAELQSDREAVFGGLGSPFGHRHGMHKPG